MGNSEEQHNIALLSSQLQSYDKKETFSRELLQTSFESNRGRKHFRSTIELNIFIQHRYPEQLTTDDYRQK